MKVIDDLEFTTTINLFELRDEKDEKTTMSTKEAKNIINKKILQVLNSLIDIFPKKKSHMNEKIKKYIKIIEKV